MLNSEYLSNLNENQREAVECLDGPLLIVAGAGSGKTKVLTSRIAHIIKKNKAFPNQILAVTFTNKAAKEMQLRVSKLLRKDATGLPWLGTFHSISAKLLRKHADAVRLKSNFSIIDQDDQVRLIKNICKAENVDIKKISPKFILAIIDKWKNKGFYPQDVILKRKDPLEKNFLSIYKIYQEKLLNLNSADLRYLSDHNKNICCVGDDDQSIYSWRGAEIKNFLEFDKVYENTRVIRLEKNYRSTQNILSVASKLIENNQNRVGKTLFTSHDDGELVSLSCFRNVKDEATEVGAEIERLKKNYSLNEVAILVRAIFQTREFEERFLKIGLPYRIVGGIKFYERAEIKDCVAYLKTIHQPFDDLSFERIINVPKRSIGDTTIKLINEHAKINKTTLENAARKLIEENKIKPKTKLGLNSLLNLLQKWREDLKNNINHNKLLQLVLDESGYSEMLKNKKDLENENRLENIKELLSAMKEFDNLESFLEHVALATSLDQDWETEKVNLMTMHASKGLEFDVVFLPGWEEGLFPHQKSIEEKGENGLEEERRLAYVGITRAKKIAKISFSMNRFYQGDWIDSMSSRFIDELPDENLKKNNNFIDENEEDFEFNQDIEFDEPIRSPGWLRYQKKLNDK